ncbi:MAG TPA: tRNA preQ1(34) S-adenosylmethionine ribosyltransferase-isomerase QueA [Candidatus Cybelea sp.]|jgi:S-adenosylmethionine:tRNA ribosyltransferase-isomerase
MAAAYDYELPQGLIAQFPAPVRDASRLLAVDGPAIGHYSFHELPQLLRRGDLLVLNETRVIPARIYGRYAGGTARVELLLLHPARSLEYDRDARRWIALAKPARRLRSGTRILFGEHGEANVVRELADGMREIELHLHAPLEQFLSRAGEMPIPPYIHNRSLATQERYQSVFARIPGSVAAPTASLHFTPELLDEIAASGIEICRLRLNVGLGTFRPVTAERVEDHAMHAEAYAIDEPVARTIERARGEGRRIVAVGTTVVRALEGNVATFGRLTAGEHATELFIRPGFRFRVVDAMITNFHLPRSTLLMLVSAFAGRTNVLHAYAEAIARRYRFYSFGDAMFVTRQACDT